MIIRKLFRVEGSHRVINCSTDRCKKSFHGHQYIIELFLTADGLDNAGMICDFGLLKKNVGAFIDSFDHCHVLWDQDDQECRDFFKHHNERWIELNINPSCECLSMLLGFYIQSILRATEFNNGECNVRVASVRVHETATGYAESYPEDFENFNVQMTVSKGVMNDWPSDLVHFFNELGTVHPEKKYFINPIIKR
jgi:6-pyruvoyltetrahydropterin/6-carboxytetrahydropterin synthase